MRWKARGVPAVCLSVFLAGVFSVRIRAQRASQAKISRLDRERAELMLHNIHETVRKNYYDPDFHGINIEAKYQQYEDLISRASTLSDAMDDISGYLESLNDSHTYFVPPSGVQRFRYGFQMRMIGEHCLVTQIRAGTAAAWKLHLGDEIAAVDGRAISRQTFPSVEQYLKTLTAGKELEFSIRNAESGARGEVELDESAGRGRAAELGADSVSSGSRSMADPQLAMSDLLQERWMDFGKSVLVWKLPWFGIGPADSDSMMRKAKKDSTLVLDLRGNPGGPIENLAYIIGWFFNHDVTIATPVGRRRMKPVVAKAHRGAFEGKLIVLVDSASASAAELFARVMQIEHRGIVVGDRTAGAVMESRLFFFHFGIAPVIHYQATITRADLIMSDGRSLEGLGVIPDVLVNPTASDLSAGRDPVLARAAQLAGLSVSAEEAEEFSPFQRIPLQ